MRNDLGTAAGFKSNCFNTFETQDKNKVSRLTVREDGILESISVQ